MYPLLHTHPHEFISAPSSLGATSFIFPPEQSTRSCLLTIMVLELSHITLRPTHSLWRLAAVLENTSLNELPKQGSNLEPLQWTFRVLHNYRTTGEFPQRGP